MRIERGAGLPPDQLPMIMGNAPPALLLVLPLGYLSAMPAELIWVLLLAATLAVSVELIRQVHGRPHNPLHLLAFSFGPAVCCILTGQMSMLVLLGLALFLYLQRSRPGWAGASLWLCLLKPQLFLPFGVVLLIWAIATPRYRILAGAAIALAASCVMIALIDPAAWSQYHHMMGVVRYDRGVLPCLANLLRRIVAPNASGCNIFRGSRLYLGARLLPQTPRPLGLDDARLIADARFACRRSVYLAHRPGRTHSRVAPRALRHALTRPGGGSGPGKLCRTAVNLRRRNAVAALAMAPVYGAVLACLVSPCHSKGCANGCPTRIVGANDDLKTPPVREAWSRTPVYDLNSRFARWCVAQVTTLCCLDYLRVCIRPHAEDEGVVNRGSHPARNQDSKVLILNILDLPPKWHAGCLHCVHQPSAESIIHARRPL